jgi:hypothetical protein
VDLSENFTSNDTVVFTFATPLETELSLFLQIASTNSAKLYAAPTIPTGTPSFSIPLNDFLPMAGNPSAFEPAHVNLIYPNITVPSVPGASYQLERIAIVPEPASGVLIIGGAACLIRQRARRVSEAMYRITCRPLTLKNSAK